MKIFVYGTLMPNQRLFKTIKKCVLKYESARVHGTLFISKAGWFPILYKGDGLVHGYVLTVKPNKEERILELLDYIEMEGILYTREKIKTMGGDECWAYFGKLVECGEKIPFGNFDTYATKKIPAQISDRGGDPF